MHLTSLSFDNIVHVCICMFVCIWAHVCAGVHAHYAGQRTTSVSFLRHCHLWSLEPGSLTGLDLISEAELSDQ